MQLSSFLRIEYDDPDVTLRDRPTNWGEGICLYKGQPFTGVRTGPNPDTNQSEWKYEYKEGIFDGHPAEYWENGNLKEEYLQKYNYHVGSFKRWDENGQLISYRKNDEFGNWVKTIL